MRLPPGIAIAVIAVSIAMTACDLNERRFEYAIVRERPPGNLEIFAQDNSLGTDTVRLTYNSAQDDDPALSSNGRNVVFASNRDGDWDIYAWRNRDFKSDAGASVDQLTDNRSDDRRPSWSPAGDYIAFDSDLTGVSQIFIIIKRDGSEVRQLTDGPGGNWAPSWSPDGEQSVFHSARDGNSNLYAMNFDGADQRRLTVDSASDEFPAWSPDGSSVLFVSDRDGNAEIYLLDVATLKEVRVTNTAEEEADPLWCRQRICYASRPGDHWLFLSVAQPGGQTSNYETGTSLALPVPKK